MDSRKVFLVHLTFCVKFIIGKRREFNLETQLAFIGYEKAFDEARGHLEKSIPNDLLQIILYIKYIILNDNAMN